MKKREKARGVERKGKETERERQNLLGAAPAGWGPWRAIIEFESDLLHVDRGTN